MEASANAPGGGGQTGQTNLFLLPGLKMGDCLYAINALLPEHRANCVPSWRAVTSGSGSVPDISLSTCSEGKMQQTPKCFAHDESKRVLLCGGTPSEHGTPGVWLLYYLLGSE